MRKASHKDCNARNYSIYLDSITSTNTERMALQNFKWDSKIKLHKYKPKLESKLRSPIIKPIIDTIIKPITDTIIKPMTLILHNDA